MPLPPLMADAEEMLFDPEEFGSIATLLDANGQALSTHHGLLRTPTQRLTLGKSQRWLPREVSFLMIEESALLANLEEGASLIIDAHTYRLIHTESLGNGLMRLHLDSTEPNASTPLGGYHDD